LRTPSSSVTSGSRWSVARVTTTCIIGSPLAQVFSSPVVKSVCWEADRSSMVPVTVAPMVSNLAEVAPPPIRIMFGSMMFTVVLLGCGCCVDGTAGS
jgi:hypothetical protein